MGRTRPVTQDKAGAFFLATLLLWFVSVWFEILFNRKTELVYIIAGSGFYQLANWVCRRFVSRDPLFVNTTVSLLHSSITSASGLFLLSLTLFLMGCFVCFMGLFVMVGLVQSVGFLVLGLRYFYVCA